MKRAKQVYSLSCLGKFDEAYLPVEKASYTLMTKSSGCFLLINTAWIIITLRFQKQTFQRFAAIILMIQKLKFECSL